MQQQRITFMHACLGLVLLCLHECTFMGCVLYIICQYIIGYVLNACKVSNI